jgi:hypothetical protein
VSRSAAFNPEEKMYTVNEVAALLRCNRHVVSYLFAKEHGVLDNSLLRDRPLFVIDKKTQKRRHLRKFSQLRIPHSAFVRVRARLEVK